VQGLYASSGVWDSGGAQIGVLYLRGVRVDSPARRLVSLTGAAARALSARGLPVHDVVVG